MTENQETTIDTEKKVDYSKHEYPVDINELPHVLTSQEIVDGIRDESFWHYLGLYFKNDLFIAIHKARKELSNETQVIARLVKAEEYGHTIGKQEGFTEGKLFGYNKIVSNLTIEINFLHGQLKTKKALRAKKLTAEQIHTRIALLNEQRTYYIKLGESGNKNGKTEPSIKK